LEALGNPGWDPGIPQWVKAWSEAEDLRPWDSGKEAPNTRGDEIS
jgi:hypothetical protein